MKYLHTENYENVDNNETIDDLDQLWVIDCSNFKLLSLGPREGFVIDKQFCSVILLRKQETSKSKLVQSLNSARNEMSSPF